MTRAYRILETMNWRYAVGEVALIVIGILIAFSIEEWRQDRADADRERVLLTALSSDFQEAQRALETAGERHTTVADAGALLLQFEGSASVAESERPRVSLAIGNHFNRYTFRPPMGTVQSVLGSGRIDLLRNEALVGELTAWPAVVTSLNEVEEEARVHFYSRVYPYLSTRLSLKDLDKGYRQFYPEFPFDQDPVDGHVLLDDLEFRNIVYTHWVLKTNILNRVDAAAASLQRIRGLIDESLRESD